MTVHTSNFSNKNSQLDTVEDQTGDRSNWSRQPSLFLVAYFQKVLIAIGK